ncbi:MAG TPA: alpha/beta fold hydrolase [Acidobacteriaceae bacterium]|nr:alpha/beta fold hydrolase [Acidobacteriaceae bacterium]
MRHLFVFLLLVCTCSVAQSNQRPIPANFLIPRPPPSAPLADWTGSATRIIQSVPLPDATLRGWEYPSPNPNAPIILFFNGNGMTIDRSDTFYRQLVQAGAELCVYDYRGIGFSAGTPDVMAFRQDALRLYDTLAASRPRRPVIVYGFSLGTAMATYVASQRKIAGLILAGTIASAAEELPVYTHAQGLPTETTATLVPAPDSIEAFNEVANIARSTAPLLMLHGEADTLVPITQGREVFAASSSKQKKFVSLPGVAHNQTPATPQSIGAVAEFLAGFHATQ